jgi:hypothetical protein
LSCGNDGDWQGIFSLLFELLKSPQSIKTQIDGPEFLDYHEWPQGDRFADN